MWAGWVPLVLAIHRVTDQEKANGTCSSLILSLWLNASSGKKGFIWLTLPSHSLLLRKVEAGTQAETMEKNYLQPHSVSCLARFLSLGLLPGISWLSPPVSASNQDNLLNRHSQSLAWEPLLKWVQTVLTVKGNWNRLVCPHNSHNSSHYLNLLSLLFLPLFCFSLFIYVYRQVPEYTSMCTPYMKRVSDPTDPEL